MPARKKHPQYTSEYGHSFNRLAVLLPVYDETITTNATNTVRVKVERLYTAKLERQKLLSNKDHNIWSRTLTTPSIWCLILTTITLFNPIELPETIMFGTLRGNSRVELDQGYASLMKNYYGIHPLTLIYLLWLWWIPVPESNVPQHFSLEIHERMSRVTYSWIGVPRGYMAIRTANNNPIDPTLSKSWRCSVCTCVLRFPQVPN